MRKIYAFAAVIIGGSLTLTACSQSAAPPVAQNTAPATVAASPPATVAATPRVTAPAIATVAQSATAEEAKAIAHQFFNSYSNGQYAFAWVLLTPSDQRAVPKATWVAVHDGCPNAVAGLSYQISRVTVAGGTALVKYTISYGTSSKLDSGAQTLTYSESHWRLKLKDPGIYRHGSVKADIAAAKTHRNCL